MYVVRNGGGKAYVKTASALLLQYGRHAFMLLRGRAGMSVRIWRKCRRLCYGEPTNRLRPWSVKKHDKACESPGVPARVADQWRPQYCYCQREGVSVCSANNLKRPQSLIGASEHHCENDTYRRR